MNKNLVVLWARLPVVVRATLIGVVVLVAGVVPWSLLASANLKRGSSFPWAVVVEVVYLGLVWQYLRGRGWPGSTSEIRRRNLRANPIHGVRLVWSAAAAALLAGSLAALTVTGWMLAPIPASHLDEFTLLNKFPLTTIIPMLLMSSIVAGVVEEAAFRGYLQVPLEIRYGPAAAIGIVAVVFSLAHFPSPLAWPGFLLGAVGWGALAHLSNSILPGIVFHAAVNAVVWIWAVSNRESLEKILASNVLEDGPNSVFAVSAGLTLVLAVAAVLAFIKLSALRPAEHCNQRTSLRE